MNYKQVLIGKKFDVLNDGFIQIVDLMGTDEDILNAARISYSKGITKRSSDKALIRYLMRHQHSTPFEMCKIKLHIRVPMDTWRQWVRHRTASVNEYSTRYSEAIDSFQTTAPDAWRTQSSTNKQGSDEFLDIKIGEDLSSKERAFHSLARDIYQQRLAKGVAREQARKDLPLSTYTEAYWSIDLRNLLNFLRLRMEEHAQLEIREYANIIGNEIVSKWCPEAWKAFKNYSLKGMNLSETDQKALRSIIEISCPETPELELKEAGYLTKTGKLNREGQEFAKKSYTITGMDMVRD